MRGPNLTDLVLLTPELILVGAALTLMLFARRLQKASYVAAGTILAALAAAAASGWFLSERAITSSDLSVEAGGELTRSYEVNVEKPGVVSFDKDRATVVPASADVSVARTVSRNWPNGGDRATIAITIANRGSKTAGVQIQDVIPAGCRITKKFSYGWIEGRPGFGGMIIVDGYSQFFKILIAAALPLVTLMSLRRIAAEHVRLAEYHALLLLASTGMMFAAGALDFLMLYLALELMTLCSYILVGITVDRPRSNEAAIKYFLLGSFASAIFLYGIALAYGGAGATDFEAMNEALRKTNLESHLILLAAIGLIVAGLAFKIAAFPFHSWAPDAYQGASAPVAAFLAAASKAAGLAALGRVCLVAFDAQREVMSMVLTGLALLSIFVGSIVAISQTDMKRLLAYSSIAHAGYALLGLVSGTAEGAQATMIYAFLYVFMTLGAFGVVIALGQRGERVDGYQGLAVQRPGAAALMLLFLLSLTGIPPTAGFVAKFVVIQSVVGAGYWVLAVLAVVCSVISAFVYLRVAILMYMKEPQEAEPSRFPIAESAALAVTALVTVLGGIFPDVLTNWATAP